MVRKNDILRKPCEKIKFEWELINEEGMVFGERQTHRLRVSGGWIIRCETLFHDHKLNDENDADSCLHHVAVAMTFIPDLVNSANSANSANNNEGTES